MKKLLFFFIAAATLPMMITSCQKEDSSDVNQDKIYTRYELFYNQNTDKTVAIARLRFGSPTGTLLEATNPASVTFNGDTLPYSVIYSGHAKEYAGQVTNGTFIYTNVDGVSYTNATPSMDTIAYPAGFDTIVKSQANTFTWVGNSLGANERVNLFVGSWTWGEDALFFAIGQGSSDLVMGTQSLSNLALGTSTVYMDRVNEVSASEVTSEGGVIRAVYRPINVTVQVVP